MNKKFIIILLSLLLLTVNQINYTFAADNFVDNNANNIILEKNNKAKIIISEYNTGKIISQKNEDTPTNYKNLSAKISSFIITENIKNNKIKDTETIKLTNEDEFLKSLKIEKEVQIKDLLFLLENYPTNTLIKSVFKHFNITISDAQLILDKLTMRQTELNTLDISNENITTVKNINYLTETTLKNYPKLTDITKNTKYKLNNSEEINNNIEFISSDTIRSLGLSYINNQTTTITYSGNTKIIITIFDITENKEDFFKTLQKTYEYIFSNYQYKLALKSGTYDINNENITINNDIYDLFFKNHSQKDIKYFLMNGKILLFQNYNYLSANSGTVYSEYQVNKPKNNTDKIKDTFIQDYKFNEKSNKDKLNIITDRFQYFISVVLFLYSSVFLIIYIFKKIFTKGE